MICDCQTRDHEKSCPFGKLAKIKVLANNALYFNDSNDFKGVLWDILRITNPIIADIDIPELKYIEEKQPIGNADYDPAHQFWMF